MATMRDNSKASWSGEATREDINAGSLQRIADAAELIAKNHAALVAERDRYERNWHFEQDRTARLERSNAALRGAITRLKRRLP